MSAEPNAIRVLDDSFAGPETGARVLAVLTQWADRPLALQHVAPGGSLARVPGVETPALTWRGQTPRLEVPAGLEGRVQGAGADYAVTPGSSLTLGEGQQVTLRGGGLTWHAALRPRAQGIPAGEPLGEDLRFLKIVAFATLAFFAAVAAMVVTPSWTEETSIWGALSPDALPRGLSVTPVPQPASAPERFKSLGDEGLKGEVREEAQQQPRGASSSKEGKDKQVKLLVASLLGGSIDKLIGSSSLGAGIDQALNALGAGNRSSASSEGLGGMGSRGLGPGEGGGVGLSFGARGAGASCDLTGCRGTQLIGLRSKTICTLPFHDSVVTGFADKDLIAKVVRRHQNEIRFCYESELQKSPDLAGKVTMRWVISPSGAVAMSEVAETTLNDAAVERCMTDRIRRWVFPVPEDAGDTVVNFPFIFSVAAE